MIGPPLLWLLHICGLILPAFTQRQKYDIKSMFLLARTSDPQFRVTHWYGEGVWVWLSNLTDHKVFKTKSFLENEFYTQMGGKPFKEAN